MDIFKIVLIGFLGTVFCVVLRETRKDIAMIVALVTVAIIMVFGINYIAQIVDVIKELANKAGLPDNFLSIILKIIGIAYIVEFASDICKDSGQEAISSKIQFAGKCVILTMGMTIIGNFVDVINKLIS
jgi:stage III sporulation protein AD